MVVLMGVLRGSAGYYSDGCSNNSPDGYPDDSPDGYSDDYSDGCSNVFCWVLF